MSLEWIIRCGQEEPVVCLKFVQEASVMITYNTFHYHSLTTHISNTNQTINHHLKHMIGKQLQAVTITIDKSEKSWWQQINSTMCECQYKSTVRRVPLHSVVGRIPLQSRNDEVRNLSLFVQIKVDTTSSKSWQLQQHARQGRRREEEEGRGSVDIPHESFDKWQWTLINPQNEQTAEEERSSYQRSRTKHCWLLRFAQLACPECPLPHKFLRNSED